MKYYIIAGEASGDMHAANLIKGIRQGDPEAEFRGFGGDKMGAEGVSLGKHYRELAFMGFVEVLKHLPVILKNMAFCKRDIQAYHPDAVILVDYPGFNLKIAKFAHRQGYKVFYYIAPQVWVWHASRIKLLRKYVDCLYPILPFEPDYFQKRGVKAEFYGHPLLDEISGYPLQNIPELETEDKPRIVIFPGSREQEIKKIFPLLLEITRYFEDYTFVVAATKNIREELYMQYLKPYPKVKVLYDHSYDLLNHAVAALVKSGTSTLETALFKVPEVVVYRTSALSYRIARAVVKNIRYISLVNLILDKEAVVELIQQDFNLETLKRELLKILKDEKFLKQQRTDYQLLEEKLGGNGASFKVGASIIRQLERI